MSLSDQHVRKDKDMVIRWSGHPSHDGNPESTNPDQFIDDHPPMPG